MKNQKSSNPRIYNHLWVTPLDILQFLVAAVFFWVTAVFLIVLFFP